MFFIGLRDIPHSLGHAYLQYVRIFRGFRCAHHSNLESLLLGWNPSDFYFREIAYAILCTATASQNLELVSSRKVLEWNEYGFSWVGNCYWDHVINDTDSQDPSTWDTDWKRDWSTEFVAHLGFGSHLEDDPPGSSPPGVIYLFSGALVYLMTQFTRPGVVAEKSFSPVRPKALETQSTPCSSQLSTSSSSGLAKPIRSPTQRHSFFSIFGIRLPQH